MIIATRDKDPTTSGPKFVLFFPIVKVNGKKKKGGGKESKNKKRKEREKIKNDKREKGKE